MLKSERETHLQRFDHFGELALLLVQSEVGHAKIDVKHEAFPVR